MNNCSYTVFGAYVAALRRSIGLTQKEAALRAKLSPPYLSQIERGQRSPPSRAALRRLAQTYNVTPQSLWSQAEYGDEKDEKVQTTAFSAERVEWLFQAAASDPEFSYGKRAVKEPLTLDQKMWFVQLWQKLSGRNLLTVAEAAEQQKAGAGE